RREHRRPVGQLPGDRGRGRRRHRDRARRRRAARARAAPDRARAQGAVSAARRLAGGAGRDHGAAAGDLARLHDPAEARHRRGRLVLPRRGHDARRAAAHRPRAAQAHAHARRVGRPGAAMGRGPRRAARGPERREGRRRGGRDRRGARRERGRREGPRAHDHPGRRPVPHLDVVRRVRRARRDGDRPLLRPADRRAAHRALGTPTTETWIL
ncbi:MAG: Hydroxymethylpyrimidine ABC transporter, transmembrane component, partial [uncultured Solirubrobacteraceae bacterium]